MSAHGHIMARRGHQAPRPVGAGLWTPAHGPWAKVRGSWPWAAAPWALAHRPRPVSPFLVMARCQGHTYGPIGSHGPLGLWALGAHGPLGLRALTYGPRPEATVRGSWPWALAAWALAPCPSPSPLPPPAPSRSLASSPTRCQEVRFTYSFPCCYSF